MQSGAGRAAARGISWNRLSALLVPAAIWLGLVVLVSPAAAGPPIHLLESREIAGLDHACGTAVNSEGDVYVSSAGESAIEVYDEDLDPLTSIPNANEPCGLTVDGKGQLYVSEAATGNVVRYKPSAYPFVGTPTYGPAEPIDSSGDARGIAIDPHDGRLYVAEGDHIAVYASNGSFEANIGTGDLDDVTGVATYTYSFAVTKSFEGKILEEKAIRYVFAADAGTDEVKIFSGEVLNPTLGGVIAAPKLRRSLSGPQAGEDFEFGSAGAYLAVDPGNGDAAGKCASVADQACTAGHFFVYDAGHNAVNEFDASGEFLDQFSDSALADAEPTAIAVDRSGGSGDGTIYVSSGPGVGAKLLAFTPLSTPSRAPLADEPPSRTQETARAVATDVDGNVYLGIGSALVKVFAPGGEELEVGPAGEGIPVQGLVKDLAVDSRGNVYVVESDERVVYFEPSAPVADGTTYSRHEIVTTGFPEQIATDPRKDDDRLLVALGDGKFKEYKSAEDGSGLLKDWAPGFTFDFHQGGIDIYRENGNVYIGGSETGDISIFDREGKERLARITGEGCPGGSLSASPAIAVDQSNGHVLAFANRMGEGREYDAGGGCVAEFSFPQGFTEELSRPYDIAIDNSCALADPPLSVSECEASYPANGNAYIAFDDTAPSTPDLWAFGPLTYGEPPLAETGLASNLGAGGARLNGTVNPRGFELLDCRFEYVTEVEFALGGFSSAEDAPCVPDLATIGKGSAPVAVHADIGGVNPGTRYHFRLVAENKFGPSIGEGRIFGPPVVATNPALPVLYTEAKLRATVDPSGLATEYHFEYGTGVDYGQSTPTVELPPGEGPVAVQASLTGLAENTTYHFRIVAENEANPAAVVGDDEEFKTLERSDPPPCPNTEYRTGLSAGLPDCRAYELVTPAETNGLAPFAPLIDSAGSGEAGFSNWLTPPRGAAAGERLSYFTVGTLPGFEGNGTLDGYRAERGSGAHPPEGWTSQLFGPTYRQAVPDINHPVSQQSVAAGQLYSFWQTRPVEVFPETLEPGIYLRTPSGFEPVGRGSLATDLGAGGRYASPEGEHVIFDSEEHLEAATPPALDDTVAIYDRPAGSASAEVVSLKPDGGSFGAGEDAIFIGANEDGSAVLFKVGGALYLRRSGQTTQVAEAPSVFAGVSEDGTHVFYAATASFTAPATLFVCDVDAGPCVGGAPTGRSQIATDAIFLNVSPDGSRVLLSSQKALTGAQENEAGEQAVDNARNLYLWDREEATLSFVAQLDPLDFSGFGGDPVALDRWTAAINPGPQSGLSGSPTRSTPGGEVFVFQSHAQLTSYDNEGRGAIYRYDPQATVGGRLLCVSCDPTAASPSADAMLVDINGGVDTRTLVANLTDDGEAVFFESPDRLLPEDANGVVDVYEWKATGAPGCEDAGGCLALISSGQGEEASHLFGMSADGQDVFFRTREKLVGQDVPGSPSIYDARVEGGIPDPPAPAPCQGDACQSPATPPPSMAPPATTGPGSSAPADTTGRRPPCGKGKHRVKGRCVKKKHKKRKGGGRANHDRRGQR